MLLMVGRQFRLPSGGWLVVGRDEKQNAKIELLRQPGDWLLQPSVIPGPSAILRHSMATAELDTAASIVTRFAKKSALVDGTAIIIAERNNTFREIEASALEDSIFTPWLRK